MAATQVCIKSDSLELLVAYYQNPSIELRNRLVNLHTGLVRKIAHQFSHQCTEPYEDLEQIGYFGLIRAIERFNPKQGYAFSSFAVPYIRGEIMHFLRDRSGLVKIPRRWQEVYNQGQKVRRELTITLGRCPTDIELARQLNISVQEWYDSNLAAQNRMALSLDSTMVQNFDCPITLGDILPDFQATNLQQQAEDREQLQGAMSQLEENTRTAVEFVFLKELSRKEAAKKIGISPMTVTRYLQRGKEQLVSLLQPQMVRKGA
ncbi:RNA polymerase sigma factor SigF [Synechocystis sp. PCC 7509]|uniref:RNA polymerase sigma factor SigF n=1 Tax=Synechocystis sp. PCC 7509 TaxID=927677 RepID=UPI0002AC0035|nr:RNA polymerase sigma factor SigF [Synechocystis sp. PCC 7509]